MNKRSALFPALALAIIASALSCDGPPAAPTVTSLEVVAPPTLAPGTSAQLRAITRLADGTTQDVSATAQWFSERVNILSIAPAGLATAYLLGEANVFAIHDERTSGRREIIVVPEGTFRVIGRVVEEDTPAIGISGALVDPQIIPAATTDSDGRYRLYGVPGQATIRVTRDGYVTSVQTLTIQDHHTQNFALALAERRPDLNGTFQLTIAAAESCQGRIPDALLRRRYTVTISQTGPRLQGELSGAKFAPNSTKVTGSIEGRQVLIGFYYDAYYYGGADMAEVLDDGTYFVITGRASLAQVGSNFIGTLDAELLVLPNLPYRGPAAASCLSRSHRVTLSR